MSLPLLRASQRGPLRLPVRALATVLLLSACTEPTLPARDQPLVPRSAKSDVGVLPNGVPLGIGGAYTLNVAGPYVTYRDPSPSGITLFPGIPVEVIVSGQVTREMTAGFIAHCELLPFACPPFLRSNAPFGPGGLEDTNLGAATSWWDFFYGPYYYTSPGGSVAYRGLSGTNLLLGRTGLYCTWGHVFPDGTVEEGDCYSMGGGFTYTVHALNPPAGQAGLTLSITKNAMGPSGGPVDLVAATTDGSQASNVKWYFIADAVTEETDPLALTKTSRVAAPASALAPRETSAGSDSAMGEADQVPATGRRVRAINAQTGETTLTSDVHTLPAGDYTFIRADSLVAGVPGVSGAASFAGPSTPASRDLIQSTSSTGAPASQELLPLTSQEPVGSPAPYGDSLPAPVTGGASLDGCANSLTCSVNLKVDGGAFVVTGVVRGVLRVAEQRVAALPEDPSPQENVTIRIVRAEGPNSKSFTYAREERKIVLEATVSPADLASAVEWEVIDAPGDRVNAIPPAIKPTGALTSFDLPKHPRDRWPTDHPGAMDRKSIRYQVTATVTKDGKTYRSEPVVVSQDLVDTIREEYYEFDLTNLGRHIPGRDDFSPWPSIPTGGAGENNGDYPLAVINPKFAAKLATLKASWKGRWQINTIYRNPVHNLNGHIPNQVSKPSRVTWHMWGCAADLQTFPTGKTAPEKAARLAFWNELSKLAKGQGWDVEPFDASTVSHVHVELDCP